MDLTMDNKTNKKISSNNKRAHTIRTILTVLNILLLLAAVVIAVMVLTGCTKEPESYPEAEAAVRTELDALKNADADDALIQSLTKDVSGEIEGVMLEGYIGKLKEFDYEIIGSKKAESENGAAAAVITRITTYDFGNEFLKAWNEHMSLDEGDRWQSQFYSSLLLKLSSVTGKNYVTDVEIICTDEKGDGSYEAELKDNKELMNAISGGMMNEITNLMTDDVVMDESESN